MFITFEGPEGAGKTTALREVASIFESWGKPVLCTREPGAGALGVQIRALLLGGEALPPETELLLFLADRSNHVATIILPALQEGRVVLCDRFTDSTLVYQGVARALDPIFLRAGNRFATRGLEPDLTVLLDLPPEIGLARITNKDRLDLEPLDFHHKVREGFLSLAKSDPKRWIVVDAVQSPAKVVSEIKERLISHLPKTFTRPQ